MDLELRLKDVLDKDFEDKYIIDNDKSRHLLQILDSKDLLDGDRFCTDSTINDPQKREVSNSIIARYDAGIQNQKQIGLVVVEPCALRYERNEYGKEIRKAYENGEVDAKIGDMRELSPRDDGVSNTLTTVQKDNLILVPKRLGGLYDTEKHKRQAGAVWDSDYLAPTLSTMQGGHREPLVVVKEGTVKGFDVATEGDSINLAFSNSTTRRGRVGKGVAQTLDTSCSLATLQEYTIRKLTPLECWRLMGFDDEDYWKARKRLEDVFYGGNDRSNSQMYKQAGNSIVVDVLESIFRNLPMD